MRPAQITPERFWLHVGRRSNARPTGAMTNGLSRTPKWSAYSRASLALAGNNRSADSNTFAWALLMRAVRIFVRQDATCCVERHAIPPSARRASDAVRARLKARSQTGDLSKNSA